MSAFDTFFSDPIESDQRVQTRDSVCWHGELLAGREAGACAVLDISPYGARLITQTQVAIDLPVTLNLSDRGVYFGTIRWHDAGMVGVKFTAGLRDEDRIEVAGQHPGPAGKPATQACDLGARVYEWRRETRQETSRLGSLRSGRESGTCRILDLSPSGARVVTERPLEPGSNSTLTIGSQGELEARVVWAIGEVSGLRFEPPDSPLVRRLVGLTQ